MSKKTAGSRRAGDAARSLHIGLNSVAATHYEAGAGRSAAASSTPTTWRLSRARAGWRPKVLLTKNATRAKVLAGIRAAATRLKKGDMFFLTYSGHGGQVRDVTGEEEDSRDETWCLYDGELIDDELYFALSRFAAGVRILVLSDSCHSGTVTRALGGGRRRRDAALPDDAAGGGRCDLPEAPAVLRRPAAEDRQGRRHGRVADPDTVLAHLPVKPRLTQHRREVRGRVDPDLGMPGQPDVDGRGSQRRVHRGPARRLGGRHVPWRLSPVPRGHPRASAGVTIAEPVHARPGGHVSAAAAFHGLEQGLSG